MVELGSGHESTHGGKHPLARNILEDFVQRSVADMKQSNWKLGVGIRSLVTSEYGNIVVNINLNVSLLLQDYKH
jgi:uncharacterized protein (UPF0303 family)